MKKNSASKQIAGMSSEAVQQRTGKGWHEWFTILDKRGARKMAHREIAAMLFEKLGCSGWWSQMVTVGYEQARGMREKHQKPDGFQISRTKTVAAPTPAAFQAWTDGKLRSRWLSDVDFKVRKATRNKSLRITWVDGKTSVEVFFNAKGTGRCQVTVQHSKIADAKKAEKMKNYWAAQLARLQSALES